MNATVRLEGRPTPPPVPAGTAAAVDFRRATIAYGRVPVLTGVDGTVTRGGGLALLGPNGAGKSTVLKAILGLVPVVDGSVTVLGLPPARARRQVAYVPQADTLDADFPVTAAQVVLMGRYRSVGWLRRPGRADREIAAEALAAVGLADRARDRFGTLSGGQRQRVLVARAVAGRPRLLLLDEPFNGVDAESREALLAALAEVRAAGTALVMSTHDTELAAVACDDASHLGGGTASPFGPPAAAPAAGPPGVVPAPASPLD